MEKALTELNGKLKALAFRVKKTDEVISKQDREASEWQKLSIESNSKAVNILKENIEERKFAKGESEEEVSEWATEVEEALARADENVRKLAKQITEIDQVIRDEETEREHRKQIGLEQEKLKQKKEAEEIALAERLEFERKKLELELEFKTKHQPSSSQAAPVETAKMPKLVITKFNGTPQDWVRFWGQFETTIDKSTTPEITKFAYLKELVDPKVRNLIDGLPFTEGGYSKAKELLVQRYGNTEEIIGAYVRNILQLPTIKERDVKKIHEFYETLLFNTESLQTLDSLNKLDAAVRYTLDKLAVIKSELAIMDSEWAKWDFMKFVDKLGIWTRNNPILEASAKPKHTAQRKEKMFYSKDETQQTAKNCLYCDNAQHKAVDCNKVVTVEERRKILSEKHLCFNCTGAKHRAANCKSKATCQKCGGKHHTSICNNTQTREPGMTANHIAITGAGLLYVLSPAHARGILGATIPATGLSNLQALGTEVVLTFFLVITMLATLDATKYDPYTRYDASAAVALATATCYLIGVPLTGAGLNPARSLGPAVFANTWKDHWVYWCGPLVGAVFAGLMYNMLLHSRSTWDKHDPPSDSDEVSLTH